jgi:hypothetical protein
MESITGKLCADEQRASRRFAGLRVRSGRSAVAAAAAPKIVTKNVVLADGTYATQTAPAKTKTAMPDTLTDCARYVVWTSGRSLMSSPTKPAEASECPEMSRATQDHDGADHLGHVVSSRWPKWTTVAAQRSSLSDLQARHALLSALLDPKAGEFRPKLSRTARNACGFLILKEREASDNKAKRRFQRHRRTI